MGPSQAADILTATLDQLAFGAPRSAGALTMVPLLREGASPASYLLFEQAQAEGAARVTEVSEAGRVPALQAVNDSDRPVLLVDGEQLLGAKQNRMVTVTVMIAAHGRAEIPVTCVESGRWSWRAREFRSSETAVHAGLRAAKARDAARSPRRQVDQGRVWAEVDRKSAALAAYSPSAALEDVFLSRRDQMGDAERQLTPQADQVGAVFMLGGRWGVELFNAPDAFAAFLPKAVRSWSLDALEGTVNGHAPAPEAATLLAQLKAASTSVRPGVSLGFDLVFDDPEIAGGGLIHEDGVVHLSVFGGLPATAH